MSGYCNWCNTLTNSIIKKYDANKLIWAGCPSCYMKRDEVKNNVTENK